MKKICSILMLLLVATCFVTAQIPINGLVGYWSFNGNTNDHSGNPNNGAIYGAIPVMGRCGNPDSAYYFDGIDDYMDMGNDSSLNLDTAVTMSVWIKFSSFPTGTWTSIFNKRLSYILQLNYTHGLTVTICNGLGGFPGFWRDTSIQDDFTLNQWYHLVGMYNDQTYTGRIYINGVEKAVVARNDGGWPYSLNISPSILTIGYEVGYGCWFNGSIDDIRLYNRELQPSEITALYNECTMVGISKEINFNISFNIYPNPANDKLIIEGLSTTNESTINVCNVQGQILLHHTTDQNKTELDISNLNKGVYIVRLNGADINAVKKIIKE